MSHVEQRHRDAAEAWLYARMRARAQSAKGRDHTEALALLLADTERAALDRAAAELEHRAHVLECCDTSNDLAAAIDYRRAASLIRVAGGLAAAPTTEDRT